MVNKLYAGSIIVSLILCIGFQSMAQRVNLKYVKNYYRNQSIDSCFAPFKDSTRNVNQIILIRHGKPDVTRIGWRNREEAIIFTEVYDSVGVLSFEPIPLCVDDLKVNKIYYSNIPRARNTAERIFADRYDMIENKRFREFERKIMCGPNIKLPLGFWLTTSRLLWMLGFNDKGIETFKQARQRAKDNAKYLAELAVKDHLIILVAHGLHNKYVAKYLKRSGWTKVRKGGNKYTAVNILAKEVKD